MRHMLRLLLVVCVLLSAAPWTTAREPAPAGLPQTFTIYTPFITKGTGTALDSVPAYTDFYQYGLNPGYYGNGWTDNMVYDLCFAAGCRTARNKLSDAFLAQWGAGIRVSTFQYITSDLAFDGITTFLEEPRAAWRETTLFDGVQSKLWQGMYEPIWDSGTDGTPVNDANRAALYIWDVVNNYGPYIDFYELINEPDFETVDIGWRDPGYPGNWWENPPRPSHLVNLHTPIYRYIRLLHIAYEIVKRYDPTAYVTPGGLGYASFLDALLRYTENPVDGSVTAAYPYKGGAYFDALSIHNYPQFGTRHWNGSQWVPDRHSDKAVEVVLNSAADFRAVLADHGFDGSPYPAKPMIMTELNVARRQIGETLGGAELQRNFTIKVMVKAQQHDIRQIYWFLTGEGKDYNDTSAGPFDLMGFYENLHRDAPGQQKLTGQGVANRTTYQQIYGWRYDAAATAALNLPAAADGAAFRKNGQLRYVLWARTTVDKSETASATITLPGSYDRVAWDGAASVVSGTNLALTGAPVFLTPK